MSEKQKVINGVYFDRAGFASRSRTLEEAREKDKTITMSDINEFFRKNVAQKRKPVGSVPIALSPRIPHMSIRWIYFFINDLKDQKFRVGMLMIDIFDKFMHVVAIKGKKEEDLASGMIECLHKMGKKPKMIFTADEAAMNKEAIQTYLQEQNIEHHRTRAHPNFSERAIRTFKDLLYRRVEADQKKGKDNIQWSDYIFEILLTYNNKMKHSVTVFTPKDARKPSNELKVKLHLSMNAKRNRVYPEVEVSDEVRIFRKRKPNEKERVGNFSQNVYTIERIDEKMGQKYYYVEGIDRAYLRFELLKM